MLQKDLEKEEEKCFVFVDDTIETCLYKLAGYSTGAAVILSEDKEMIGAIDLFSICAYVLNLYEGTLVKQERQIVHREYDPWYWGGFDTWIEKRTTIVKSSQGMVRKYMYFFSLSSSAQNIIQRGAFSFFSDCVRDLISNPAIAKFTRTTPPQYAMTRDVLLAHPLNMIAAGYSNLLVCLNHDDNKYEFVTEIDMLNALYERVVRPGLPLADVKITKLGLAKKPPIVTRMSYRALMVFSSMSKGGISSVPVCAEDGKLMSEISMHHLQVTFSYLSFYFCSLFLSGSEGRKFLFYFLSLKVCLG